MLCIDFLYQVKKTTRAHNLKLTPNNLLCPENVFSGRFPDVRPENLEKRPENDRTLVVARRGTRGYRQAPPLTEQPRLFSVLEVPAAQSSHNCSLFLGPEHDHPP